MIATVIVGVLGTTAILILMLWRLTKSVGRAERDPKYLRRNMRLLGLIYVGAAVFAIVEVATGQEPIQTLFGLPIGLLLAWLWLRQAGKVKIPPS